MRPAYLLLVMVMLGILIYINYWHHPYLNYITPGTTKLRAFAGSYLLYFVPFALAFFIQPLFFNNCGYFKKGWFWAILFLAPALFSLKINIDWGQHWMGAKLMSGDQHFYLQSADWVVRVFVLLVPIYIIWLIKDKGTQPFYGVRAMKSVRPYIIMLCIMVPLITLASTQADFLHVYPKAKFLHKLPTKGWLDKWRYIVFELCYGVDFIGIEVFFRGFLILGLKRICGLHCIIPTACFYCAIHFGKPMGEAVSSFFGGTLLGIVAYNTGSILGGLLVHLGIAWMMEVGGWLSALFIKIKTATVINLPA